jgi:hypothetical protein
VTKSEKADTAERYYSHRKKPLLQDLRVTNSTRLYSGPDLYGLCSVGNVDEMGGMRSNLVGEGSLLEIGCEHGSGCHCFGVPSNGEIF